MKELWTNCSSCELIRLVEESIPIIKANKDENVVDIEDEEELMNKNKDVFGVQ